MSDFIKFKEAVQKQLDIMSKGVMFSVDVDKDYMWNLYLDSFPEGTNLIYKERREYDCQCCKQFIKNIGAAVSIVDNKLVSIWDIDIDTYHKEPSKVLSGYVKSKSISNVYYNTEVSVGTDKNHQDADGSVITWDHFYYKLPNSHVMRGDKVGTELSRHLSTKDVFKRSLEEITKESAETVQELIEQNSLYRGEEHKGIVDLFVKHKNIYDNLPEEEKDNYTWVESVKIGAGARIRNSVIGTLMTDLSEGMELDKAVKSFETKVAPANYKRPTALITKSMIANAQKKVEELGLKESLPRRFAVADDLTINNVLFADRSVKPALDVFGELAEEVPDKVKNLDKVEEVSAEDFVNKILPKSESVEVMLENRNEGNLVSLVAPVDPGAKGMFKWGNNFSWDYKGGVADSMKERVKEEGGRVDGVLRFTHSWNHGGKNQSLMDLHIFMPGCTLGSMIDGKKEVHDYYPSQRRVGWNKRKDPMSGGVQDVDYTSAPGANFVPIENITFPTTKSMPEGKYVFAIHNWSARSPNISGFKAEIELDGELHQFEYPQPLKHKEWVRVGEAVLKDGRFTFKSYLPSTTTSKEVWGIKTQKFHKVNMVMNSPNHWDGEKTGNHHLFFVLDGCKNPDKARGFYNEFLNNELTPHRKVFEVLGSKMKAENTDNQLSGLGFSSTKRDYVLCKVKGSFSRVVKVKF